MQTFTELKSFVMQGKHRLGPHSDLTVIVSTQAKRLLTPLVWARATTSTASRSTATDVSAFLENGMDPMPCFIASETTLPPRW